MTGETAGATAGLLWSSSVDLSGRWRAALADDDLRRSGFGRATDDERWESIDVPGHWQSVPAFADSDGPLVYRRTFEAPRGEESERVWLVLDGVFYQSDVWFDGVYLGDTEGYFFAHQFEITAPMAAASEHLVAVEVACPRPRDLTAKRAITGVFQHWDCLDPAWNPGGVWRPVRVERTGPIRVRRLKVLCREADEARAVLALRAELDASEGVEEQHTAIRTRIFGVDDERSVVAEVDTDQTLAGGTNVVEWTVTVERPRLWWPWSLGEQVLHDVEVSALVDGSVSDQRVARTGFREVAVRNWLWSVNGEQLFVKGANLGPTRMALAEADAKELTRDVALAKDAGLDLLRVHGHVSRPELYAATDAAGMLVWQDFPLQWGYDRGIRKQAVRQAREAVYALGHHPSIALWCGHNEPIALNGTADGPSPSVVRKVVVGQELPTWNRSVLDRSVRRAFSKSDRTRPVIAHSGVWPHLPQLDGTDAHLYFGWYHGDERQFPAFCRTAPRMVRFVGEFGAQAVPEDAAFMEPERWPDLDWPRLRERHGLQKHAFDRYVPPSAYATFDDWRRATQGYQATLLRHHIETLRRLKYRPTGGFCLFSLVDSYPSVSWAILGHDRSAKLAYHTIAEACHPVIVVADRLPGRLTPKHPFALDVHVVSDRRTPLEGAVVTATARWAGGKHRWRWRGDVAPDSCERVGTMSIVTPDAAGPFTLELDLVAADVVASNRYETRIVALAPKA